MIRKTCELAIKRLNELKNEKDNLIPICNYLITVFENEMTENLVRNKKCMLGKLKKSGEKVED